MLLLSFLSCTATLVVHGPVNSNIYVVKDQPPSSKKEPSMYVCEDVGEVVCSVSYLAWEKYYWGVYDGNWSETGMFQNEVKVVPAVVGLLFLWPVWAWAYGPAEFPVTVDK